MHGEEPLNMNKWLADSKHDDDRRFQTLSQFLTNRRVLDFGCGAGGFLTKAQKLAKSVHGVELDKHAIDFLHKRFPISESLADLDGEWDLITLFHVLEHLKDPRSVLKKLSYFLAPGGKIIIEVPNSDDALIKLYNCDSFQNFIYWSQHLFLFNANTLSTVIKQSGLELEAIKCIQRYPLSNHLHWLSQNSPGGHEKWGFLNSKNLNEMYESQLASLGITDTIMAFATVPSE